MWPQKQILVSSFQLLECVPYPLPRVPGETALFCCDLFVRLSLCLVLSWRKETCLLPNSQGEHLISLSWMEKWASCRKGRLLLLCTSFDTLLLAWDGANWSVLEMNDITTNKSTPWLLINSRASFLLFSVSMGSMPSPFHIPVCTDRCEVSELESPLISFASCL